MNRYYVYEHWREDENLPFYVGKGKGKRALKLDRNPYYRNIVTKLRRLGLNIDIRIIADNLSEDEAYNLERERISYWRSIGIKLTNLTEGGDGLRNPLSEVRAKLRIARIGKTIPIEIREKISAGVRLALHAPGMHQKLSNAITVALANPTIRKRLSEAAARIWTRDGERARRSAAVSAALADQAIRARMSVSIKQALADPDLRENRRKISKERMADPVVRAAAVAILQSSEVRQRAADSHKTQSYKEGVQRRSLGRKDSPETKAKKAAALIGRPVSEETRAKLAAQRGWKHTDEAKQKMRQRAAAMSPETKSRRARIAALASNAARLVRIKVG